MTEPRDAQEARARIREILRASTARAERSRGRAETPITREELALLSDDDLDDRVWLRLCHLLSVFDPISLQQHGPEVAAYVATRVFEWEAGNGGLHQFFFNLADADYLGLVLDGYTRLGLDEARRIIEGVVAPVAAAEAEWRNALRDGSIETFMTSYAESRLPDLDDRIELHDAERLRFVRANPAAFAR